jgi:hypothetical protein
MAIVDKSYQISEGSNNHLFWSKDAEFSLLYVTIKIEGSDGLIDFDFVQSNLNETDKMAPIKDHKDEDIVINQLDNDIYFVAIDTMFGSWGQVRFNVGSATQGTIRIITQTKTP